MGYECKPEGIEEAQEMFKRLGKYAGWAARNALYQGAGLMADKVNRGILGISTQKFKWASARRGETRKPSPEEKEILKLAKTGIAKFEGSGTEVQTSVGIKEGYWMLGKKPKAARLIANAINSGTSFMPKQPFFRKAVTLGQKQVTDVMKMTLTACVEAIADGKVGQDDTEGGTSE